MQAGMKNNQTKAEIVLATEPEIAHSRVRERSARGNETKHSPQLEIRMQNTYTNCGDQRQVG
jgi:hypothetical protein